MTSDSVSCKKKKINQPVRLLFSYFKTGLILNKNTPIASPVICNTEEWHVKGNFHIPRFG